jgi:hypothetical protein
MYSFLKTEDRVQVVYKEFIGRLIRDYLIGSFQWIDMYGVDLSLNGQVLVSLQWKFQFSALLIGTFPLFFQFGRLYS